MILPRGRVRESCAIQSAITSLSASVHVGRRRRPPIVPTIHQIRSSNSGDGQEGCYLSTTAREGKVDESRDEVWRELARGSDDVMDAASHIHALCRTSDITAFSSQQQQQQLAPPSGVWAAMPPSP